MKTIIAVVDEHTYDVLLPLAQRVDIPDNLATRLSGVTNTMVGFGMVLNAVAKSIEDGDIVIEVQP